MNNGDLIIFIDTLKSYFCMLVFSVFKWGLECYVAILDTASASLGRRAVDWVSASVVPLPGAVPGEPGCSPCRATVLHLVGVQGGS